MGGVVFGCIAPHGGMLIPGLDEDGETLAHATRAALTELGRRLCAHRPDTIVVVTPHGNTLADAFSLLDSTHVEGVQEGNGRTVGVEFPVDQALNLAIMERSKAAAVPVVLLRPWLTVAGKSFLPLDWGATIPLWFLARDLNPPPQVVIAAPGLALPWSDFPAFGKLIRDAATDLGRRIAFVASADLGHAHDAAGPYGFDPAAAEYDAASCAAVREQDLGRLLHFDPAWVERAKPDALWQMLNLHGALADQGFHGELLSYEVPTYFGMLCAAYERPFDPTL